MPTGAVANPMIWPYLHTGAPDRDWPQRDLVTSGNGLDRRDHRSVDAHLLAGRYVLHEHGNVVVGSES
jgi:hypothetical protein